MCHGSLDPRYAMREAEDRLRTYAPRSMDDSAPAPAFGLLARLRAAFERQNWKEATDV